MPPVNTKFSGDFQRSANVPVSGITNVLPVSGLSNVPVSSLTLGGVSFDPGFFGGFGFGPPVPPAPAPTPAPAPATGPSVNLQALLASIPIAQDGQIITANHHNSLRAAGIG